VVVVGAGIVGSAIAVHLADHGIRPVVVDPDRPAQGASVSSFASLSAFGKDPVASYELACGGMASWSRWAERLGGDVGLRRDGEVRWAGDPQALDGVPMRRRILAWRAMPADRLPIVGPVPWLDTLHRARRSTGTALTRPPASSAAISLNGVDGSTVTTSVVIMSRTRLFLGPPYLRPGDIGIPAAPAPRAGGHASAAGPTRVRAAPARLAGSAARSWR
jgi:FAD dependent oxidoreductase